MKTLKGILSMLILPLYVLVAGCAVMAGQDDEPTESVETIHAKPPADHRH